MALTACRECEHQVSTEATACPQCGVSHPAVAVAERGHVHVDNSRAWLLAAAPILSLCIDAALLFSGFVEAAAVSLVIALAVNVVLSVWDSRYVRSRGYDVSTGIAVFLVPVYLWQRSRATQQSQALAATWIGVFIVSLAGSAVIAAAVGPVTLDMVRVQALIKANVDTAASTDSTVSCPSKSNYLVHDTFDCQVSDATGNVVMRVTVESHDGSVTWRPVGGP